MQHIDPDHHDGTSDATPGGFEGHRRPGELVFAVFLTLGSGFLLWNAYGISGFDALSAPGSVPMATTLVMLIAVVIVLLKTMRLPKAEGETVAKDILPLTVILFAGLLVGYGLLLKPLGFLPTSALFLIAAIKSLSGRNWAWVVGISLVSLLGIWLVFRIVFTVLMPAGIVPEAEIIQVFRNLIGGAK